MEKNEFEDRVRLIMNEQLDKEKIEVLVRDLEGIDRRLNRIEIKIIKIQLLLYKYL